MTTPDELAGQREVVLARLNDYALTVSDHNQLKLLRDLEVVVIRSDKAVTEVAALKGVRPRDGLFDRMRVVLRAHP
jgi:hypothetical protein